MKTINIINQLPWKRSNGKMNPKNIGFLIVHHEGEETPPAYDTLKRIKADAAYHTYTKNWGHISYHYMIDNIGDVYQCLPETEIGYHAGNYAYNLKSIAVCLLGNFEKQQPTAKQKKALADFITWITTQRPDLPKVVRNTVKGHRDVRQGATACPGKNIYKLIK